MKKLSPWHFYAFVIFLSEMEKFLLSVLNELSKRRKQGRNFFFFSDFLYVLVMYSYVSTFHQIVRSREVGAPLIQLLLHFCMAPNIQHSHV